MKDKMYRYDRQLTIAIKRIKNKLASRGIVLIFYFRCIAISECYTTNFAIVSDCQRFGIDVVQNQVYRGNCALFDKFMHSDTDKIR